MQVGIEWASACVQVSEHEHPARHVCPRIRVEKTPILYSVCQALPHMLVIIVQWLRHVRLFVIPWTPGFPFLHHLPEFAQTHVCWLGDAIQPSHPLLSPFPPAFNLSQQSGSFPVSRLFASGGQRIGVSASAPVLPMSFLGLFPLWLTGWISLPSRGLSRILSSTTAQKW